MKNFPNHFTFTEQSVQKSTLVVDNCYVNSLGNQVWIVAKQFLG